MGIKVYLDHAAATPLDDRAFKAMRPFFSNIFYNPSSSHAGGREARVALEQSRARLARVLGAKPNDIILTAGATESIYLAVHGLMTEGGHVVIGATEHDSVRAAVEPYSHTITQVDKTGYITPEAVRRAIQDDTRLVTIALADSELGTVQPIADIARELDNVRAQRLKDGNNTPLYFHSDGSQAAGALDLSIARLGVDLLTLNAAKCYGPKQAGLLWIRSGIKLSPLFSGGGQERGLRSGTENVANAVGFATAVENATQHRQEVLRETGLMRRAMAEILSREVPRIVIDGHPKKHLPGHLHVSILGLDAERVVFRLDSEGIALSTGAACAANKQTRSKTLEAIGMSAEQADGSLRITIGRLNNLPQVKQAAKVIARIINEELGR